MHLARKTQAEIPTDFETALVELEALVERLERGDLPLEEALRSFERGVGLTRQCQGALQSAQQKVEILLKKPAAEAAGDAAHSIETFDAD
jgi:exodeoxyribonuclease VII small subunit